MSARNWISVLKAFFGFGKSISDTVRERRAAERKAPSKGKPRPKCKNTN